MEQLMDFIKRLFTVEGFPARWYCGRWTEFHGWLYILSDLAIWGAYFVIPFLLFRFIRKRKDMPFLPIFGYFIAFILSCGITHLLDVIIFWQPIYHLSALARLCTAIISWLTIFALSSVIPKALLLKSPHELEEIIRQKTAELTLAHQQLAEKELLFRTLVNSNPDIITLMDTNRRHLFVNDSVTPNTGKNPDFFIGKSHKELGYPPQYINQMEEKLQEALDKRKTVKYETSSWELEESNPYFRYYELDIVPLLSDNAPIDEILIITKDVSHQKKVELELKEKIKDIELVSEKLILQNKKLQEFAHITSHNLRAPAGNLKSLYELYLEETGEEGKQQIVDKMGLVTDSLYTTINDLAEVVKIQTEINKYSEKIILENKLKKVSQLLIEQINTLQVQITSNFEQCPIIYYPKIYLESILLNLISNAIKYRSPERTPKIHLETKIVDNQIVMTCEDNGSGIDLEKHKHKIFGLYKTFHKNSDSRGVGLFITKNQIESMGGEISVTSTLGVGTTFIIIFNKNQIYDSSN